MKSFNSPHAFVFQFEKVPLFKYTLELPGEGFVPEIQGGITEHSE